MYIYSVIQILCPWNFNIFNVFNVNDSLYDKFLSIMELDNMVTNFDIFYFQENLLTKELHLISKDTRSLGVTDLKRALPDVEMNYSKSNDIL